MSMAITLLDVRQVAVGAVCSGELHMSRNSGCVHTQAHSVGVGVVVSVAAFSSCAMPMLT